MTTPENLREQVIEHLINASDEDIDRDKITDESSLRDDFDLSSLQAVTLVMDLEDEFGVVIEDEEIENLETVGDVLSIIESKQSQAS